jgi:hypothetical protein
MNVTYQAGLFRFGKTIAMLCKEAYVDLLKTMQVQAYGIPFTNQKRQKGEQRVALVHLIAPIGHYQQNAMVMQHSREIA